MRAILIPLLCAIGLRGQVRYTGELDPALKVVDNSWMSMDSHASRLPMLNVPIKIDGAAVFADLKGDGKYAKQNSCFDVPLVGKSFPGFPVCIRPQGAGSMDVAIAPWVVGHVIVGSQRIDVGYEYDLKHDSVDPRQGWLGVRESAAGPVNFRSHSAETAYAEKEKVVFRVGALYLSTESIDLKQRRVVLRSHPASDYFRIELRPGVVLPDWNFTDLQGRLGSLKSYAGKYVLLDVWTPSCGPCLGEFAALKAVAERFAARNFEILGVLGEDDEAFSRKTEADHKVPWRTAAGAATLEYAERRLRIASWPTHILIDPAGHVVSAETSELRGDALVKTLDKLLPPTNRDR